MHAIRSESKNCSRKTFTNASLLSPNIVDQATSFRSIFCPRFAACGQRNALGSLTSNEVWRADTSEYCTRYRKPTKAPLIDKLKGRHMALPGLRQYSLLSAKKWNYVLSRVVKKGMFLMRLIFRSFVTSGPRARFSTSVSGRLQSGHLFRFTTWLNADGKRTVCSQ